MNAAQLAGIGALLWVSGNAYLVGNQVISPTTFYTYTRKTNGAGTVDPSTDTTNWLSTSGIKSIQRGTTVITSGASSTVATITAVDMSKTEIRFLGSWSTVSPQPDSIGIYLASTTQVVCMRQNAPATTVNVSWEITERY